MKLEDTKKNWEAFAHEDPLFAILTEPDKRGNRWDPEEFFATGRKDIREMMEVLDALGLPAGRARALDFGCGVGRLVQSLADYFDSVCGVDISREMIRRARELNRCGERAEYVVNESERLEQFPAASFDLVHSVLVLQHVEPSYAKVYIAEFLRLLKPGGVAWFQVPHKFHVRTWLRLYHARLVPFTSLAPEGLLRAIYLKTASLVRVFPRMEMHCVPRSEVEGIARRAGCEVVRVTPDQCAGEMFDSFTYLIRKPGDRATPPTPSAPAR